MSDHRIRKLYPTDAEGMTPDIGPDFDATRELSYLDRLDGVGEPYRLVTDCHLGAGRHRSPTVGGMRPSVARRWSRRAIVVGIVVLVMALAALWASQRAKAETFTICPSGLSGVASEDTSCAFADNVRRAWYTQPGLTVIAYSPVTEKIYTMQCRMTVTDVWEWDSPTHCFGFNESGAYLSVYVA